MGETKTAEKVKEIVINPEELREGACQIKKWGDGKVSICKEKGVIKIFEVEKEE